MTRSMLDAAFPPSQPPKVDAVAFYIGGGTPHVWTAGELADTMAKSGATFKLPIFVRVPPTTRDPHVEAQFCVDWARDHGQPAGTVIALDYETAINPYWFAFDRTIQAGGYKTLLYGSLGSVVQNVIRLPDGTSKYPSGGYWSAHWTNVPHICPNPHVTATQYGGDVTIGQPWDISRVADSVPLWSTQGDTMSAEDVAAINKHTDTVVDSIKAAFVKQLRAAVGPDDGSVPAGVYFGRVEDKLDQAIAAARQSVDPAAVAALVAGELEITGISTDAGGRVTVTFGPATP